MIKIVVCKKHCTNFTIGKEYASLVSAYTSQIVDDISNVRAFNINNGTMWDLNLSEFFDDKER